MQIHNINTAELVTGECLRSIPGRRAVYEGVYQKQNAIIKVFSSVLNKYRHFRRELKGLQSLAERGINAPGILTQGRYKGNWVLVLEKIENANDVFTLFEKHTDSTEKATILKAVLEILAQMHQAGILQEDLHLGNFLWDGKQVYAMDPAQIRFYCKPVNQTKSLKQVAALTTTIALNDPDRKELLQVYFRKRQWDLTDLIVKQIKEESKKISKSSIQRNLNKTLRTSKRFIRQTAISKSGVFERTAFNGMDLSAFMVGLDDIMKAGEVLKRGNTCMVTKIHINGRDVVVKRYNHKSLWHSIRHTCKGNRAKKCWLFGHRLDWLGIATAKPLAFIEERKYGLVWQSWIINEYISGKDFRSYVSRKEISEHKKQMILEKTHTLLAQLIENNMIHGDLKLSNILVAEEQPVLIDLDSMKHCRTNFSLKLYTKKMKRNFNERNIL